MDAAALHRFEQWAEVSIARKQHDVIDMIRHLKGVDNKFDSHITLEFAAALAIVEIFCRFRYDGKAVVVEPID